MAEFVHLHVHDQYSTLDGICKTAQLAAKAKELGFKALAQTNHGNVDGVVKFYRECKKQGIKPILGSELYVVDKFEKSKELKRYHALVLAKNFNGLRHIMKALTIANQEQFYYKPLVTIDQLMKLEDVVVMTACSSGLLAHPDATRICKNLYKAFGKDFYFETQPFIGWKPQKEIFSKAVFLSKKSGIPLIVTNDIHYLNKEEHIAQEVALAIGQHKRWTDKGRWKLDVTGLYLKTPEEVVATLVADGCDQKFAQRMVANSLIVSDRCNIDLQEVKVDLPIPSRFNKIKKPPEAILQQLAIEGLAYRGLSKKKEYVDRLKHELSEVCSLGFATYFLILTDTIWWCRENDLMTGPGRGSVGGSLLAYCLRITYVDPLQYNLSFERFISPGRIDLPDIDVDFQDDRREEVISYFKKEYGEENVLQVRTFNEMHGRQALRDVARVFNVSNEEVGRAAKAIIKRSGGDAREDYSIEDAFTLFEECKEFKAKHPKVVSVAASLEGVTRQGGIHAAGVVISKDNLYDGNRCVVIRAKDNVQTVNWDKKDIEQFGLMKLDILGLSTLTVLHSAKQLIKLNHKKDVVFEDIDLQDKKVLHEFARGNTVGVFQFGTAGLGVYCREIGVTCFEDLVDVNALWRPGTLKSGMTAEFKEIKNHRKEVTPVSGFYDKITQPTLGIMLYQEQIMQVLYQGAGIGWRTVDTIRKAISKSEGSDKIAGFKKEFMDGCKRLGTMAEEEAAAVFDKMVFFGSYGFNKSHAVAYTKIGFWTMWLKVYYPTEFYCSLINFSSQDKKMEYADDARKNGMKILLPDVNYSDKIWSIEKEGLLRAGLSSVSSISERSASEILKSRKGKKDRFGDLDDFLARVPRRVVNRRVVQNLGKSGALRSLGVGVLRSNDSIESVLTGKLYDASDLVEENAEILSIVGTVVDFSPSSDPLYKISALVKRISHQIHLSRIQDVLDKKITGELNFIGRIDKIKFSYRDKVTKNRDDLGGAYGNFFDGSNHLMITFDQKVTHQSDSIKMKKKIETAEDCWVLIRCSVAPDRRGSSDTKLLVRKIVFLEELIGEVDLDFIPAVPIGMRNPKANGASFDDELLDCHECNLRDTCKAPVRPNRGIFDSMIICEAPGKDEDEEGRGLVGKAGGKMWDGLLNHGGLTRPLLHVNNVVKCRPPNNKIPNINYAHRCGSLWLDKEIKEVKPLVILASGGTAADFFIKGAKITELNSKIIWNPKYSCWVVYCLHPASIIYEQANKEAFYKALTVFSNLLAKFYKK